MTSTSANSALKSNEQASATQAMVEAVDQAARWAERLAGIGKTLG